MDHKPWTLDPGLLILNCTLHPMPYTLYLASHILSLEPQISNPPPLPLHLGTRAGAGAGGGGGDRDSRSSGAREAGVRGGSLYGGDLWFRV